MALTLMYITNSPEVAEVAEKCGVDRIWIDLETLGKEERQKGMNTVKSQHCVGDIRKIKPLLKKAELLVRVNPWNGESEEEINRVIAAGADIIMLDNMSPEDMKEAIRIIDGRAETECSGNVTKENIDRLTSLGVDYISSGALTHSAPVLDISLKNLHAI